MMIPTKKYIRMSAFAVLAFLLFLTGATVSAAGEPSAVQAGVAENGSGRVYELYIMSMCPYGTRAIGDLTALLRSFPQVAWNVWFIGRADGDKLSSLRGEPEVYDETLWLAVRALYPARYFDFLVTRAASQASTEKLLEEMGLDVVKIRQWAKDSGVSELRRHYLRSVQMEVNASPTLFINGVVYGKRIIGDRLTREECDAAKTAPPFCGGLPDCFDDGDCKAPGKLGTCVKSDSGRVACEFRDDAAFKLTALVADSALDNPEKPFIETVKDILPGARVKVVKISSEEGKKLFARYAPDALPFIHFERSVEGAFRFSAVKGSFEDSKTSGGKVDGYKFQKGVVKENYFPLREEKPGVIELYADPAAPGIGGVINALLSNPAMAKRITMRPLIPQSPGGSNSIVVDKQRAEEALRWLVLAEEFPKKYLLYLNLYADDPASTYWFKWLTHIGVNQKKFLRRIEANRPKIVQYLESIPPISSSGESAVLLLNNKTMFSVPSEGALQKVLSSLNK